jgi:hypothetical protein
MPDRGLLAAIFDENAEWEIGHLKVQLAYRHMLVLADNFEGWSMDRTRPARRDAIESVAAVRPSGA